MRHSKKRKFIKLFVVSAFVAAFAFAASNYFLNKKSDEVIAKVNGQNIFKSEVERKLRNVFDGQNQEVKIPQVENLPKEVIEVLVKEIYFDKELTKEAKKSGVAKNPEVEERMVDAKDKILRQTYIDSLIKKNVNDQKINEKYAELNSEIAGKKEYLIAHIIVKSKDEAEKIAAELKSKKFSEKKFGELAKKYSLDQESAEKSGSLGYILEDNMIKEIADAVLNLKAGEVSGPVQTKFGWHIIKVSDIREASVLPFESVKENIRNQMIRDEINSINSKIIKDAKIEIIVKLNEQPSSEKQLNLESEGEAELSDKANNSQSLEVENSSGSEENKGESESSKDHSGSKEAIKESKELDVQTENKSAKSKK